jgi:Protein of unknown function (DUF998)
MALGIAALVCFAVAVAALVRVHFLPTGIRPVPDAVSDYGTTPFHRYYRVMVVGLGAGAILLAIGLHRDTDAGALAWLWIYGVSRIAIAAFMTDRDPPPFTTEGRIHYLLAATAFTAIAVSGADIDWSGDPGVLHPLGYAVAVSAGATLVARVVEPLRPIFGLTERVLYLTSIAWLVVGAIDLATTT